MYFIFTYTGLYKLNHMNLLYFGGNKPSLLQYTYYIIKSEYTHMTLDFYLTVLDNSFPPLKYLPKGI